MVDQIKVCVDRILPTDQSIRAAERAIVENPANIPVVRFRPGLGVVPVRPRELAALTGKKWQNGRTLRVRFLDGVSSVKAKVEQYAQQWSQHANIAVVFGSDPDAEIRISFQHEGSWSYLGTDALLIPRNSATMNFGWLTQTTSDDEYSRVVIHEFGHALGCIHEHQHPDGGIPWDKDAVYRYYMGPPNNWTRDQVDSNLFETYSKTITQYSVFDPDSIMLYAVPNQFTIGDFEIGWNRVLSPTDKEFIGVMYPKAKVEISKLTIGGPPFEAAIGKHGEEDLYQVAVQNRARYRLETEGRTDVVMALLGPDNQTNLVDEDDDSGKGLNARIVRELHPGTYFIRVRHFRPTGTGKYTISARKA